jgi:streptogramin lyase
MSRRTGRLLTVSLAVGLVLSVGSAALAAPVGMLKQFKVPTANSDPRAITNGSDGNRWFTEGTDSSLAPAKIGRVTLGGAITEFNADCNFCILTDIDQGPAGIVYMTSNNPILVRFDVDTQTLLPPIDIPDTGSAQEIDVDGDDVWFIADSNSLVRYNITAGQFTEFPLAFDKSPADVVIDAQGDAWFTAPLDGTVNRFDPETGAVAESFPVPDGLSPRSITIATDGQLWFTSRFVPQGVGRLNPTTGVVSTFLTPSNPGPEGIAASPDGTVWFTQTIKGNVARIDNGGVITEAKAVKNSETFGITVAPNGNPWFTMMAANKIATLQLQ